MVSLAQQMDEMLDAAKTSTSFCGVSWVHPLLGIGNSIIQSAVVRNLRYQIRKTVDSGKAVVFKPDGSWEVIDGRYDAVDYKTFKTKIGCDMLQYVPCTVDPLRWRAQVVCDENGYFNNQTQNILAMILVGQQVCGGMLLGTIVVCPEEDAEESKADDVEKVLSYGVEVPSTLMRGVLPPSFPEELMAKKVKLRCVNGDAAVELLLYQYPDISAQITGHRDQPWYVHNVARLEKKDDMWTCADTLSLSTAPGVFMANEVLVHEFTYQCHTLEDDDHVIVEVSSSGD